MVVGGSNVRDCESVTVTIIAAVSVSQIGVRVTTDVTISVVGGIEDNEVDKVGASPVGSRRALSDAVCSVVTACTLP